MLLFFFFLCFSLKADFLEVGFPFEDAWSSRLDPKELIHPHRLEGFFDRLSKKSVNSSWRELSYMHGLSVGPHYKGAVYDPLNQKIIFIPQNFYGTLHRYNCRTGKIEEYSNSETNGDTTPYFGGAYDPYHLRIIFAPYGSNSRPVWHYYDCVTETIKSYSHGSGVARNNWGYVGAVFDPIRSRIVFVPSGQSSQGNWHYYDCLETNVTIRSYPVNVPVGGRFHGGVYNPYKRKIIFVPNHQYTNWNYYDCEAETDGDLIKVYAHGQTLVDGAYEGGAYDPVGKRIIFAPGAQANQSNWHYYDCLTETAHAYAHGRSIGAVTYSGAVLDPSTQNIFFVPRSDDNSAPFDWHYYDCHSGQIGAYTRGTGNFQNNAIYFGGAYDPIHQRILFAPDWQRQEPYWHGIQAVLGGHQEALVSFAAHYLFNKF